MSSVAVMIISGFISVPSLNRLQQFLNTSPAVHCCCYCWVGCYSVVHVAVVAQRSLKEEKRGRESFLECFSAAL